MDTPLHTPVPAALKVTLYGDLIVLTAGQVLDQALIWQARMGQAGLGERLLALAAGPADAGLAAEHGELGAAEGLVAGDGGLAPDLAFGRALTRRILRGLAVAAPTLPGSVGPEPEALTSLLAAAPPLEGHNFLGERSLAAAWRAVARAVEVELGRSGLELAELLRRHGVDPELGRICLHLVERPGAEERPFAFLGTVARSPVAARPVLGDLYFGACSKAQPGEVVVHVLGAPGAWGPLDPVIDVALCSQLGPGPGFTVVRRAHPLCAALAEGTLFAAGPPETGGLDDAGLAVMLAAASAGRMAES